MKTLLFTNIVVCSLLCHTAQAESLCFSALHPPLPVTSDTEQTALDYTQSIQSGVLNTSAPLSQKSGDSSLPCFVPASGGGANSNGCENILEFADCCKTSDPSGKDGSGTPIPEPATSALWVGLAGIALVLRRRGPVA